MQGFVVFEAASGAEALLNIQEHRPDLVTLDLNLPDLDGVEVCRRLRKFSDAYVVMLTARADEIDELMGLEIGADDFISKPFSPPLGPGPRDSGDAAPPPNPSTPHPAAPRHGFHAVRARQLIVRDTRIACRAAGDSATPGGRRRARTAVMRLPPRTSRRRRRAGDVVPNTSETAGTPSPGSTTAIRCR